VETEHRENDQGQVEKHVQGRGVEAERAFQSASSSPRSVMNINRITTAITASDTADPKGQSRAVVNWFCTRLPTMTVLPPPSRPGCRNAPTQGMKTRMDPARIPGAESGITTRSRTENGFAPKPAAASRKDGSCRSSVA